MQKDFVFSRETDIGNAHAAIFEHKWKTQLQTPKCACVSSEEQMDTIKCEGLWALPVERWSEPARRRGGVIAQSFAELFCGCKFKSLLLF